MTKSLVRRVAVIAAGAAALGAGAAAWGMSTSTSAALATPRACRVAHSIASTTGSGITTYSRVITASPTCGGDEFFLGH